MARLLPLMIRSRLTPTGHERAAFAAMHGFDLLYSAWSLGLGSSRCSGASSLACSAATPPRLLNWPHEKMDRENSMRAIGLVLLSIAIMALLLTDADAKRRRSSAQGSQAAG